MILRELLVKFGLDFNAADFAKANSAVDTLKNGAVRLAQVLAAGLIARELRDMVTHAIDAGASIDDMAQKTGVAASAIQELRYAAKLSGVEIAQLDKSLVFVSKLAGEAAIGNQAAAESFAQYGIKIKDANGSIKTGDVLLSEIADKMKNTQDATARLTMATTFFGAKNSAMTILLKEGSGALAELRQEAIDLGYVMSQDMIDQAAILDDNFDRLRMAGEGLRNTIAGSLFPSLLKASGAMIAWTKANRVWLASKIKQRFEDVARAGRVVWNIGKALHAGFSALTSIVGGTSNAMLLLAAAFAVKLVIGIGSAIVATEGFTAAQLAARAVAMGNALLMGVAFLALAAIIVLTGEEIAAMFSDTDGFFERMAGKWHTLRDSLMSGIGGEQNPLIVFLRLAGAWFTHLIGVVDDFFDTYFKLWNVAFELIENGGVYIEAFIARVTRGVREIADRIKAMFDAIPERLKNAIHLDVFDRATSRVANGYGSEFVRPSPIVQAAQAMQGATVTNAIDIKVDANGQSLDEAALTSLVARNFEAALERQNAQVLAALTPETAQ